MNLQEQLNDKKIKPVVLRNLLPTLLRFQFFSSLSCYRFYFGRNNFAVSQLKYHLQRILYTEFHEIILNCWNTSPNNFSSCEDLQLLDTSADFERLKSPVMEVGRVGSCTTSARQENTLYRGQLQTSVGNYWIWMCRCFRSKVRK